MFTRSSSSASLGSSSGDAKEIGSGGLLHGLRKKTLLKMARSSSASSASLSLSPIASSMSPSTSSPYLEKQEILDARTRYFLVLMKRFQEQDCSLRQLEAELGDMLIQIQNACSAMTRAVEVFTQTFRYDATSYKLGVDYLTMMKQIACDGVEMMEQSIRFTVVDPILTRLERHNQLKGSIHAWERLHSEVVDLRLSIEQLKSSGKDERRRRSERQQLMEMQEQLAALQDVVTPLIEETTETYPAESQVQLFDAMRLQLALFFYNTNQSLFGGLSETESEIVRGSTAQQSSSLDEDPSTSLNRLRSSDHMREIEQSVTASSQSVSSPEVNVDKTHPVPSPYSSTDKDRDVAIDADDLRASTSSSITIEEFEPGKSPPDALLLSPDVECEIDTEIARSRRSLSYSEDAAQHASDIVNLLALASNPVVPDFAHDTAPYDQAAEQPDAEKSDDDDGNASETLLDIERRQTGVFSSFKRSMRGKFRVGSTDALPHRGSNASPTGSFRTSRRSNATIILPSPPSLSVTEWRQIERCLWEMDRTGAPSPPKRMLPPAATASTTDLGLSMSWNSCSDGTSIVHCLLDTSKELFFECTSFLPLDDIGRLTKVDPRLRATLRSSASVWKQCIRSGGLAPSVRGAVWLDMLYGKTPWESSTTAPHHLSGRETREKIYEQLLMKVGTRMANSSLQPSSSNSDASSSSISEENQQLLEWLHEIDVDVARTCNKDIYAKDVADDWNATFSLERVAASEGDDDHALIEALVESALLESLTETETTSSTTTSQSPQTTSPKSPASSQRPDDDSASSARGAVEAKIRRVLRAYAMYNPRVGYCQGMNFLVRVLLEVSDNEADVFWLFVGLSEPEINRNLYEPGLAMLQPLLAKFELLVSYHMPELYVHFQREGVHVAAFSTRWFMTFFSSFETFGPSMVLRVLDLFVIDGWRVLLSMGLVVLDELRGVLVGAELEDILRILQFPRNYLVEPDHARRRQLVRHALAFCVTRAINTL